MERVEGSREGRERGERDNRCEEGVNLIAHPLAGLFELFAFGDALLRLLHILLSLLHLPLYAVHQSALQAREKSGLVLLRWLGKKKKKERVEKRTSVPCLRRHFGPHQR